MSKKVEIYSLLGVEFCLDTSILEALFFAHGITTSTLVVFNPEVKQCIEEISKIRTFPQVHCGRKYYRVHDVRGLSANSRLFMRTFT